MRNYEARVSRLLGTLGVKSEPFWTFHLVSGFGIILSGCYVLYDFRKYLYFMEKQLLALPAVLIIAGCIVILVASLGCYGIIRETYYRIMAVAAFLVIILFTELSVALAAVDYQPNRIEQVMWDSMDRYYSNEADRIVWDELQIRLRCCGVHRCTDWNDKRPLSCCYKPRVGGPVPTSEYCKKASPGDQMLYTEGCLYWVQVKAKGNANRLFAIGIGIAFIEVVGIVFACTMALSIKNRN